MKDVLRALSLLKPYKSKLFVMLVITVLLGVLQVVPAFVYQKIVNTVTDNQNNPEIFYAVLQIIGIYFILLTIQTVLSVMHNFLDNIWSREIYYELVQTAGKNVFSLQQDYFLKNTVGEISEKLINGVRYISNMYFDYMIDIISPMITALISIVILVRLDPRIGLIILAAVPLYFLFFRKAMEAINTYAPERRKMEEKANGKLNEALYSIESTKVNSTSNSVLAFVSHFQNKSLNLILEQNKRRQLWGGLAGQTQDTVMIIALTLSAYLIFYGDFTLGDLVLVTSLSTNLLTPIRRILFMQLDLKEAIIGIRRFFEVLDAPKEDVNFTGEHKAKKIQGAVRFEKVTFSYQDDNHILNNISFEIDPGKTVALVGPSGSGKTTITKLLCGLYVAQKGVVSIDNVPITSYDLDFLRENIAIVFQDPFVFSDTLKNNLKFVKPSATNKEIDRVIALSNMKEFVKQLPNGLDTEVGERGIRLSGGQKQRLAIAQALLKDTPIIIFDEATSSLDAENEKLIQEAMKRLMKNRTTFIISHRLSTVVHANTIIVMQRGKIIEIGTHSELRANSGLYEKLYNLQVQDLESIEGFDLV